MDVQNIFELIPKTLDNEFFDSLLEKDKVKIERIVSKGHTSPEEGWHEQDQAEWVIVLQGAAKILLESGEQLNFIAGSHFNIPAKTKHKVIWTEADIETVWLAVHY